MLPVFDALSLIKPYDINEPKLRVGPKSDGGYVMVDFLDPRQHVLSYGISTEYRFDEEMADRGHQVFMFDHTIGGINVSRPGMQFFKEGVAGVSQPEKALYSIEDHLRRLQIEGSDLILKMDVEGFEYQALLSLPDPVLSRFSQITFEIHDLKRLGDAQFRIMFVNLLEKLNRQFTLFHVHANNFDGANTFYNVGGMWVSTLLELSFVRSNMIIRSPSRTVYPTQLDYPNVKGPDKLLWMYPFAPLVASTAELRRSFAASMDLQR